MSLLLLPTGAQMLDLPRTWGVWYDFLGRWGLTPEVAMRALLLGYYAREVMGERLWILSGEREEEEQAELRAAFAAGRIEHEPAENSLHLLGRAFDVGTDYSLTPEQWEPIGQIGELLGLRWGGRFENPDRPHFDR